MKQVHFCVGNSNSGPIGMCASLDAETIEEAHKRLLDILPESLDIKSNGLNGDEYITVYLNRSRITITDIDDVDES